VILLDTCALIWSAENVSISPEASAEIARCAAKSQLYLSSVSAWEVGMAVRRKRLELQMPVESWVARVFSHPSVQIAPLTPEIAIRSCFLAGEFHADPVDRFLVATAIEMGLQLITRDAHILSYGRQGYVSVMAC
jgi:PIN domain nuclease of toxin-antitoxin system